MGDRLRALTGAVVVAAGGGWLQTHAPEAFKVASRGVQLPLEVYKVDQEKGWGVRCRQDIPIGTFVCEYVGELISEEMAVRGAETNAAIRGAPFEPGRGHGRSDCRLFLFKFFKI